MTEKDKNTPTPAPVPDSIKYIAVELYDDEIRYNGTTIYKGTYKSEDVDKIVEEYKAKAISMSDGYIVDGKYYTEEEARELGHKMFKKIKPVIDEMEALDAEIIERVSDAVAAKDCEMRGSADIRRVYSNRIAQSVLSALRSHFHITIIRKE